LSPDEQKDIVLRLVADVGFEPVDAGDLRTARLLEPLGMLRMQLEETEGRSRDFAFLLASRAQRKSLPMRPCNVVEAPPRKVG
jgi:hypothetical protein